MSPRSLTHGAALVLAAAAAAAPLAGQSSPSAGAAGSPHPGTPSVRAVERTAPIALDGRLDEPVWTSAPAATGFTQQDPDEGKPATQPTEVRLAFDAEALYIGARMHDSLGAAGVRTRLVRRDANTESDWLMFVLDTYHDHSGRTIFQVNPSGVKYDAGQATPFADPSWDPVWEAATRVDSLGWTAELRIPWSQLRFSRDPEQTWGMQVWRYTQRLNETSMWSFWGKNDAGGPARFGHVEGLRILERPRGFEILPYSVARASYVAPAQPGSPFHDDRAYNVRVGADVKALLGSSLTLSATLNPDFGQVEVDPAVVNLSAFETFFEERRPFFVEGSGLFSFGGLSCFTCSNVSGMSLFYSRRIGRQPQGALPGSPLYWDVPENTAILGAAKVTGRLRGGWELGLLDALTDSEQAGIVYADGARITREVEPLTNYLVGRARRTFHGGNTTIGGMATSVVRRFAYDSLGLQLPEHAEAAGVDWTRYWSNRAYELRGNLAVSQVSGDPAAILRAQQSSARYFQRPDREHGSNGLFSDRFDPALETLRGYGGYLRMAKQAGLWQWESQVNFRSPGFEVNDLAFLSRADYVWLHGNLRRRWTVPTPVYRFFQITAGAQREYNYDGDVTDGQAHLSLYSQFPNYWETGLYMHFRPEADADRLTRGGPVARRARNFYLSPNLSTDPRRAVVVSTAPWFNWTAEGARSYSLNADLRMKPAPNVLVSLGPSFTHDEPRWQYVRRWDDPTATHFAGQRVAFAELEQNTLSLNTRLGVTFTPTLTLELFAQPFVSSGEYSGFKEFAAVRSLRSSRFDGTQLRAIRDAAGRDSVYLLDPDRDPSTPDFSFANPDFNIRSLRGNAVLRWEYRPGSTLFLVWQQNRRDGEPYGDFRFGRDAAGVFRSHPDNVFVVKATYWIGR